MPPRQYFLENPHSPMTDTSHLFCVSPQNIGCGRRSKSEIWSAGPNKKNKKNGKELDLTTAKINEAITTDKLFL